MFKAFKATYWFT